MSGYVTDKQIKDETDELLIECLEWAIKKCEGFDWNTEDVRSIGITRFLYLKDKVLNHSPKYYREKEVKGDGWKPIK